MKQFLVLSLYCAVALNLDGQEPSSPAEVATVGRGTVTGSVRWDSRPIAGVTVRLCADARATRCQSAVTDEGGNYAMVDVAPGEYEFFTEMPVGPNTRWIGGSVRIESGQTYNQKPIDVVKSDLELVPFPSSEPTSDRPTLKWKAYPGADSYRVFVSPLGSGDFTRNVFQQVNEPQFTVSSPLAPGEYHWHVTAYHGRGSIADLGLNSGRFCVGERLIRLAAEGDVGGVKSLVAAGADSNIVEKCSEVVSGWTALMAAARNGSAAVATELIRAHADVNARTHFGGSGATALDVAVAHGHADVASVIKAAGGTGK